MKVYAVYSIPKSPEYRLEGLFKTKEGCKKYIQSEKNMRGKGFMEKIYDIQIEDIQD